jgi:hypothetical protein
MSARKIFGILLRNIDLHPRYFVWTWGIVGLEAYGRLLGARDYKKRRDHRVWEIATSTKKLQALTTPAVEAAALPDAVNQLKVGR